LTELLLELNIARAVRHTKCSVNAIRIQWFAFSL